MERGIVMIKRDSDDGEIVMMERDSDDGER